MTRLFRRIWFAITLRRREDDLVDELALHRQMKADELRANGVAEADIAAATQRSMGNDLLARERSQDEWVSPWLQDITKDITFGVRMLAKDRRFTLAAVLALSLGIGVNSSVFAIVNLALFKELPFHEAERLVDLRLNDARGGGSVSPADFLEWRASATSFEGLAATAMTTLNLSDDANGAERLRGAFFSFNTERLLRVSPVAGRGFMAEDEQPGAPAVVLISYEVWQARYGGEPVVGRAVRVNGAPSTIVGVMPPRFAFPMLAEAWVPLTRTQLEAAPRDRRSLAVFGRLKDGVTIAEARAEMTTMSSRIADQYPRTNQQLAFSLATLKDAMNLGRDSAIMATLLGAVGFVLLVACANVASLLLARATHRTREMAVRASLGATRWRLIRQLLIECSLIALVAAMVGYWLSRFGAREIARAFGVYEAGTPSGTVMPYWVDLSTDAYQVMFVGVACLVASLGIGLAPAWHLARTNLNDVLKDGGRTGAATVRARALTGSLIVGQLALTVVLVSGAGLMLRTFAKLYFTDLVVDTQGVAAMRVVLPVEKYPTFEHQRKFFHALDERLSTIPAFASAALVSEIPFMPLGFVLTGLHIQGEELVAGHDLPQAYSMSVGPRFFETLGLAVVRGRSLAPADDDPGQEGTVVNERFAARFFPNGDAIGRRIRFTMPTGRSGPWLTIAGISRTLPSFVRAEETEPVAYVPLDADVRQPRAMSLIVRGTDRHAEMRPLIAAARAQVAALDPNLPIFAVQTLDNAVAMGRNSTRLIGSWFVTIGVIALVLAAVGLYAMTAHSVSQRTQEIGVRMALGAQTTQVLWLFMRRAVTQLVLGVTLGIAGTLAVGQLMAAFVRDTNPRDPLTLGLVCALLIAVMLSASVWPARKAARVDPVEALRAD
jgi:putative ABC transport system permease protein